VLLIFIPLPEPTACPLEIDFRSFMPGSPSIATSIPADSDPGWVMQWLANLPGLVTSQARWVSLSLPLPPIDLLTALSALAPYCQSPQPWHFYLTQPTTTRSNVAMDILCQVQAQGPTRFSQIKHFCQQTLADICIYEPGEIAAYAGSIPGLGCPRVFCSFSFFDQPWPHDVNQPGESLFFPVAWAVLPRWQLTQSDQGTTLTLNSGHPPDSRAWQELTTMLWGAWYELQQPQCRVAPAPISLTLPNLELQAQAFQTQVQDALTEIATGTLEKLVLACALDIESEQEFDGLATVAHLRQTYPSCYSFSLSNGQGQRFIGASPERLVHLQGQELVVDALAGSAPRSDLPDVDQGLGRDLQHSHKDLREHQVIVDFLHQAPP